MHLFFEQPAEVVQNFQLTLNVGRLSLVFTLGVNKARENCKYKFNDDFFQEIYIFLWPWAVRATSLIISQHDEFFAPQRKYISFRRKYKF